MCVLGGLAVQEVVDVFTGKQTPNLLAAAARDAVPERCARKSC